jgi:hypothetical protein
MTMTDMVTWQTLSDAENRRLAMRAQFALAVDAILNDEEMRGWVSPDMIGELGSLRARICGPAVDAYIERVSRA